jgi:hypothetical protein
MLKQVAGVRDEVLKRCVGREIDLETIVRVFTDMTVIDHVVFVRYDTSEENPIWGEFTRWSRRPSVYESFETIVEIRYASHLIAKEDWLRFIICKELCHSLEEPDGGHDVSPAAISKLVDSFALLSAGQELEEMPVVMQNELLAQVVATELLFPLGERRRFIQDHGESPGENVINAAAAKFKIPPLFIRTSIRKGMLKSVESLLTR